MDGAVGQRAEQQIAQLAAVHLRTVTGLVVRRGHVHRAVGAEQTHGLTALVDERAETVVQTGRVQRLLPVLRVDVEHAALRTGRGRRLQFEDRRLDAVDVQDAGGGEAAEAAADDRDGVVRGAHRNLRREGEAPGECPWAPAPSERNEHVRHEQVRYGRR